MSDNRAADVFRDPLNEQASVLVDLQTDIKTAIKKGVLSGTPFPVIAAEVRRLIAKSVAKIRSPTLAEDARRSLPEFFIRAYSEFMARISIPPAVLASIVYIAQKASDRGVERGYFVPRTEKERAAAESIARSAPEEIRLRASDYGLPLGEFQKTYMNRVTDALGGLAEQKALDPNDLTGRNSLRNLAEMQVRYERHQSDIQALRDKDVRLVVCSVHADCSDRCKPWQGRVYSLDGTTGTTDDGRKFVPLETATDVEYETKAGRRYKNGLLGFNCRHKLFPYKSGMVIPSAGEEEQKREYAITRTQRAMERAVIDARERALMYKGEDRKKYLSARREAIELYAEYKRFSKENGRAYYPDRVKIL